MSAYRMQSVRYAGDIWEGQSVQPDLWALLMQRDLLIQLASGGSDIDHHFSITLGVPHHAAPHVDKIADDWINPKNGRRGRTADETTGLFALALYSELRQKDIPTRLLIAAHPTDHDPNKTQGSPYWEHVFAPPLPGLLLELHGSAERRNHILELSAGRNRLANPLQYGKTLAYYLQNEDWILAVQSEPGSAAARIFKGHSQTAGTLQTPALETHSLVYAGALGLPALHLEMKSRFREPDPEQAHGVYPSKDGWRLARAIAQMIETLFKDSYRPISAQALGLHSTAQLIMPSEAYLESFWEAVKEGDLPEYGDIPIEGFSSREDLAGYIASIQGTYYEKLPGEPPEEFLWLVDKGEFIGRFFFFHALNEYHRKNDGQIDYWIRPSKRRQGYGHLILQLGLERFRQLGVRRVLISCLAGNIPSRRIIESTGGVFEGEVPEFGDFRRRYWIDLN